MQTLKTSAIVILIMTFLYAAYVSMTTPPDPLPPGVDSLLVESGMAEFPEDFGDFGIENGTLEEPGDFALAATSEATSAGRAAAARSSRGFDSVDQMPTDLEDADALDPQASFQMSDLAPALNAPRAMERLPAVDESTGRVAVSPEAGRDYPSTGADFRLPDPVDAVRMSQSGVEEEDVQSDEGQGRSRDVAPARDAASDVAASGLANAIATADRQFASDRRREALATLSLFYETPNLTSEQREQLLARLDPLARDVIYSAEHLLEEPHRVGANETLMDIGKKYDVPWQLLANINGVSDPVTVLPGTDLKVVRGPFRADVDLENKELTLFLGDLYAGRFPVGIGSDPAPRAGTYSIQEKKSAKTYYDMAGSPVPPGNPRNPYGSMWIDLGQGLCLHGSPKPDKATDEGCISIAGNYSRDVFGILSEGSSVTIR